MLIIEKKYIDTKDLCIEVLLLIDRLMVFLCQKITKKILIVNQFFILIIYILYQANTPTITFEYLLFLTSPLA